MGGRDCETAARLPARVTLLSLGLGLVLFFTSTAPAWTERDQLRNLLDQRNKLRALLDTKNESLFRRSEALQWDLQALLVEIDRQGFTPEELLESR